MQVPCAHHANGARASPVVAGLRLARRMWLRANSLRHSEAQSGVSHHGGGYSHLHAVLPGVLHSSGPPGSISLAKMPGWLRLAVSACVSGH
jgi:hypothetical protein